MKTDGAERDADACLSPKFSRPAACTRWGSCFGTWRLRRALVRFLMADVDSLLSELDGLLKDSPPAHRPPQRPSAAAAAPRLAPGRPEVEDDIESLLSSLGGAEAFSSSAASRATCAPRATCPPALAPSSSSAPPDGASCETTCVPRCAVPMHAHVPQAPQPPCLLRGSLRCSKCDFKVVRFDDQRWSDSVDYMFFRNFMGNLTKLRTPNPTRTLALALTLTPTLTRTRTLTRRPGQATSKAAAAGGGRRVRLPVQLVHDRQLGRQGATRLLVPNAMSVPVQSSSPRRRHVRLQGLGLGRRKRPEEVGSSVQTPRKPPSKRAPSGHMHHDFWFRTR